MTSLLDLRQLNLGNYFYKLAEKSHDVFWIRDVDCKTQLYVSPAYETLWGVSRQKLYENRLSWITNIHPDDITLFHQSVDQIQKNIFKEQGFTQTYRIIRPDQEIRAIQEVSFALHDAQQRLIGFAGISKDVTQEKKRLAELEKASHYFRYFTEKIGTVFWVRDANYQQLYLSPAYEKIWGRSREWLYNNPDAWIDTLVLEDRYLHTTEARYETLKAEGYNAEYVNRYRIYTPEGDLRWIKDTSFPIYDEQKEFIGFAGIAEDITKEVLHEKELQEAKQRAEVANQAKSDFLAMISHELRTPLNAILGMAQILKQKDLTKEHQEYIDIISHAGNSLLSLVSDILDFVRLEAGKLSFSEDPFDLKNLFTLIVSSMRYQAEEKGLILKLEYPPHVPTLVLGDANRIRQVLVNLLSNAIKFTDKGFIKVIVNCIEQPFQKGLFEVQLIDTGIGIAKDKLEHIFEKFSQVDSIYHRKQMGIGLGLTITKELVTAMGGEIKVQSECNRGSEFCFTLLLKLKDHTEPQIKETGPSSFKIKRAYPLTVLLVEDNLINQKVAKIMLEDLGCKVDIFMNGREVLNRLDQLNQYQLIFMDVGLPDISGFDIVKQIRQKPELKNIPIIAMTAHVLERDKQQALSVGMNRVIAKPISYETLAMVLEEFSVII